MTQPPPLQFRWPWRDYQARLLEQLPDLVADQRLHVVAAPGSGKTVLGLEVFRRLGVPTVVLSPTRTIRDQWLARLDDFLPANAADPTAWTSRDLSALRFFNSLTYQALHARTRAVDRAAGHGPADEEPDGSDDDPASDPISAGELADVASVMRAAGIGLIILDEAHHLRADWWAALQDLVSRLEGVRLVSLTATPPYDVVGAEWERYLALCGTIDAEIAVPELVKAATLCPHEDLVWLSTCPDADRGLLSRHRRCVQNLTIELLTDEEFIAELEQHPWVEQPGQHLRALTATPATARAMLSLMRQASRPHEGLLEALGIDADDVESLEPGQWELLLAEYLFGAEWDGGPSPERRRGLATRLRRDGLLWRREVSLAAAGRGWPDLGRSPAKVRSCVELHELERRHRGEQLRQVVPTDRIAADSEQELGAWPVFRALVESAATSGDEAAARQVLLHTGRLTVFHSSVVPHVEGDAPSAPLTTEPVPELPGFVTIAATDTSRLTRSLARLLSSGIVHVVVGTRALLGEGWDAPAVNSLVLATTAASYVSTNQMRGRAMRRNPFAIDKAASIWHLATVAELAPGEWDVRDLRDLWRRFDSFMGVAAHEPHLTTGIGRLESLIEEAGEPLVPVDVAGHNDDMAARLMRLTGDGALQRRWDDAITRGELQRTIPTVRVPVEPRVRPFRLSGARREAAASVGGPLLVTAGAVAATAPGQVRLLAVGAGVALCGKALPPLLRDVSRWARFRTRGGRVEAVGRAVRDGLVDIGLLPTELREATVLVEHDRDRMVHVALAGGSFAQQSRFADAMAEALGGVRNPRYLLVDRGRRVEHHVVPGTFGSNADRARAYLNAWHEHVGAGELVYTRTTPGRAELLRAQGRTHDLIAHRTDRWH
jgi:hypothetical protein